MCATMERGRERVEEEKAERKNVSVRRGREGEGETPSSLC